MAESITEGTLKQWNKKLGEFVSQDEEVATIETDKIDVSVNAPQSGKITELFASEEDTVEVGADLFNLEPGEGMLLFIPPFLFSPISSFFSPCRGIKT